MIDWEYYIKLIDSKTGRYLSRFREEDREDIKQSAYVGLINLINNYTGPREKFDGLVIHTALCDMRDAVRRQMELNGWRRDRKNKSYNHKYQLIETIPTISYRPNQSLISLIIFNKLDKASAFIIRKRLEGYTDKEIGQKFLNLSEAAICLRRKKIRSQVQEILG